MAVVRVQAHRHRERLDRILIPLHPRLRHSERHPAVRMGGMVRQQTAQQFHRLLGFPLVAERHRQIEERIRIRRIPLKGHAQHRDPFLVIARFQEIDTPFRERLRLGGIAPADDDPVRRHHHLRTTALSRELLREVLAHRLAKRVARQRTLRLRQLTAVEFVQRQLDLVGWVRHQVRRWG